MLLLDENNNIKLAYNDSALITVYLFLGSENYELSENETVYFKVTSNTTEETTILLKECEKEAPNKLLIEITHENSLLFSKGLYLYDLYVLDGVNQYTIIREAEFIIF